MKRLPKIEIFLTLLLTLFCIGLTPVSADCCKPAKTNTNVARSCCRPDSCCCRPVKAPLKVKQELTSQESTRRENIPFSVGLVSTPSSDKLNSDFSKKQIHMTATEPVRSKLFLLYRALLI